MAITMARRLMQITLLAAIIVACISTKPVERYSDKYDNIDVHAILKNNKLRLQYYRCFAGDGPCVTSAARFLKSNFLEAFLTSCVKCTERQKEMYTIMVDWYTTNAPAEWEYLVKKLLEQQMQMKLTR